MTENPTGINELLDKIYGIAFNRHILTVKKPDFYFRASYNLATRLAHAQHVETIRIYGRIQQKAIDIYSSFKHFDSEDEKYIPENDYRVVLWMVYALMYFNEAKTPGQSAFLEMLASRIDPEYSPDEEEHPFAHAHEISFVSEDANKDDAFVKISRLVKANKLELTKYKCALPRVCASARCFCQFNNTWKTYEIDKSYVDYLYSSFTWMDGEAEDFEKIIAFYKTFDEQYTFYKGLTLYFSDKISQRFYAAVGYAKIIGTDQDPIKKILDQGKMLQPESPEILELPSLPLPQQTGNEASLAGNEAPQDGNICRGVADGDMVAFRERCNDVVEVYRAKCKALEAQINAYQKKADYFRAEKDSDESIADFNDKLEKKYKNLLKQYEELKEKNRLDNENLTKMSDKVLKENNELKKKVEELQGVISAKQDFDGICLDEENRSCNSSQAVEGDGESVRRVLDAIMTFSSTSDKLKDNQVEILSEVLEEVMLDGDLGEGMAPSVQLELLRDIREIERNRIKIKARKAKPTPVSKMADQINISLGEQTNQHQGGTRQLAEDIVDNLLSGNAGRKEVNDD